MSPRTHWIIRTSRWLSVAVLPAGGMKSSTWPTPASVKKPVTSTAVSGKYICLVRNSTPDGRIRKRPPRSSSSSAPNTLGESNRDSEPVDRTVGGHQCGGLQVSDESVFGDRGLGHGSLRGRGVPRRTGGWARLLRPNGRRGRGAEHHPGGTNRRALPSAAGDAPPGSGVDGRGEH